MKKQTRYSAFSLWLFEFWGEPSAKIIAGFVLVGLIAIFYFAFGPARTKWDFWKSDGLGTGWECTFPGKGARICIRDVPPALQKSYPNTFK
jgi:hypothetical protein